jgi:hypothetical protein
MLRREVGKSKVSAQSVELFVAGLKAHGVSREGFRRGVNLVGDKAKCFRRDQLARPQKPPRVAERAKVQGEAQPIAIAPTPVNRRQIGASQGPVPDQRVQLGRQGEQLIELCDRQRTASRHGRIVQNNDQGAHLRWHCRERARQHPGRQPGQATEADRLVPNVLALVAAAAALT